MKKVSFHVLYFQLVASIKLEPQSKKKVKVESERKVDVNSEMVVDDMPIISTKQDPDD